MNLYLVYLASIFLIIATPGPSALLVIQHSASHGAYRCLYNALGSISASFLLIATSLAGVAFLFNDWWMNVLSITGAIVLIYIGLSSFKRIDVVNHRADQKKNIEIFKESFLTGISNPKDIIFFITLLPQFIDKSIPYYLSATYLTIGWVIIDFSIMMGYAFIAHIIAKKFDEKAINNTRKVSGALIIAIGGTLFFSSISNWV